MLRDCLIALAKMTAVGRVCLISQMRPYGAHNLVFDLRGRTRTTDPASCLRPVSAARDTQYRQRRPPWDA